MKIIIIILLTSLGIFAPPQYIPAQFKVNGQVVLDARYFLITNFSCKELYSDGKNLTIPDGLGYPYYILLVNKTHQVVIPVPYSDVTYLNFYYDIRKHHNEADSISGDSPKRNKRYFRRYTIDYGNGMVGTIHSSNVDYIKKFKLDIKSTR